jgi:release factor glutamine methyltransferase
VTPEPSDCEDIDAGDGFARGNQLYRRHREDARPATEFELLGRSWTLLSGVFGPVYTPVTEIFTSWLDLPAGGTFLEMGSGAGVTAVVAALSGCTVTALDISHAAVENTRLNAERHGVAGTVTTCQSDLFDALDADDRFDLIYWNSNFASAPRDYVPEDDLAQAFFDPGYDTHRRFLAQAPAYLARHGRLLLGFSSIGSWSELHDACRAAGLVADVIRSQRRELEVPIEFQLVELRPAGPGQ